MPDNPMNQKTVQPQVMPAEAAMEFAKQVGQQATQSALRNPEITRFYTNGLGLAMTATDISIVFSVNAIPLAVVDMAYGTAKDLLNNLIGMISAYEKATAQPVKSSAELQQAMAKVMAEKNVKPA